MFYAVIGYELVENKILKIFIVYTQPWDFIYSLFTEMFITSFHEFLTIGWSVVSRRCSSRFRFALSRTLTRIPSCAGKINLFCRKHSFCLLYTQDWMMGEEVGETEGRNPESTKFCGSWGSVELFVEHKKSYSFFNVVIKGHRKKKKSEPKNNLGSGAQNTLNAGLYTLLYVTLRDEIRKCVKIQIFAFWQIFIEKNLEFSNESRKYRELPYKRRYLWEKVDKCTFYCVENSSIPFFFFLNSFLLLLVPLLLCRRFDRFWLKCVKDHNCHSRVLKRIASNAVRFSTRFSRK